MNALTHSPSETREVAGALATLLEPGDVVLLSGDLGAGKTEFAKGVAAGLGVTDTVVSPTFTLAREYEGRLRMLHVDLYRVASIHEVLDLGLDDLAGSEDGSADAVVLVEWGDIAASVLPTDHLLVHLAPVVDDGGDDDRSLTFSASGPAWTDRLARLDAAVPPHLVRS